MSALVLIPLLEITGMQPNRLSKSPMHSRLRMECKKYMEKTGMFVLQRAPNVEGTWPVTDTNLGGELLEGVSSLSHFS